MAYKTNALYINNTGIKSASIHVRGSKCLCEKAELPVDDTADTLISWEKPDKSALKNDTHAEIIIAAAISIEAVLNVDEENFTPCSL